MKITVFGASGATGHELIKQSLEKDYRITAFVRDAGKLKVDNHHVKIVQGDVKHYADVSNAIEPDHAVLIALGAKTPFKRDPVLIRGMQNIVKVMEEKGARRIVYLSFAGVKGSRGQTGFLFEKISATALANLAADHEEKEQTIRQSALLWTIVRPAILTRGPYTGETSSGEHLRPRFSNLVISRADVADFMLQQLTVDTYMKMSPLLSK